MKQEHDTGDNKTWRSCSPEEEEEENEEEG